MNKVLFLELNEFNKDLLQQASLELNLKHIQKLVSLYQSQTFTEDTYESDFLEPWVQWVSVHTGTPSSKHQIKHLGDVPYLGTKQIWEKLSHKGITSGIWGAMNANRNNASHCHFFLPDPWTASENAYPHELNHLLDPLRYATKNYLNCSKLTIIKKIKKLLSFFISNKLGYKLICEIPSLFKNLLKFKGEHFVFISCVDYLSTLLFQKHRENYQPDFSLIFINSLAHLQHHHWHDTNYSQNARLKLGLKYLDRILAILFNSLLPDDMLIVANALSQKNTHEEKPWILYRQLDQNSFLRTIGLNFLHVESHMTHDAHIFFEKKEDCLTAKTTLEEIHILGNKLFLVEDYPQDPKKLFYRICFTDKVPSDTQITVGSKNFNFFDLFKPIVQRTGKHIPYGTVLCNKNHFPQTMKNHEIFDFIIKACENN